MAIPLPSPPTDNLYKFIVLLSTFLFAFATIVPHILLEEFHSEYTKKIDQLNDRVRELQLSVEVNQDKVDRVARFTIDESENIRRWMVSRQAIQQQKERALSFAWYASLVSGPLGIVAWYFRAQRYQDRVSKAEAEMKEHQLQQALQSVHLHTVPANPDSPTGPHK